MALPAKIGGAGGWLTASPTITDPLFLSHQRRPQAARPFKTAGGAERTHPSGRPRQGRPREPPAVERKRQKGAGRGEPRGARRAKCRGGAGAPRKQAPHADDRADEPKRASRAKRENDGAKGKGRASALRSPCR